MYADFFCGIYRFFSFLFCRWYKLPYFEMFLFMLVPQKIHQNSAKKFAHFVANKCNTNLVHRKKIGKRAFKNSKDANGFF